MQTTAAILRSFVPQPRRAVVLPCKPGIHALFLCREGPLPLIGQPLAQPIYIRSATGRGGLAGRCHFNARRVNQSPRKSLAVLLMKSLNLRPVFVRKPNSTATWGLDAVSELVLSEWMHRSLAMSWVVSADPLAEEKALVLTHAPALNLKDCQQSEQHKMIRAARRDVLASLRREAM